jgi:hypothetical protein
MPGDVLDSESCGPQPLPAGEPTNERGLDHLSVYAQIYYRQIIEGETHPTRWNWCLGHALVLAKKAFGHGQWTRYLKELGIDKTRASSRSWRTDRDRLPRAARDRGPFGGTQDK